MKLVSSRLYFNEKSTIMAELYRGKTVFYTYLSLSYSNFEQAPLWSPYFIKGTPEQVRS